MLPLARTNPLACQETTRSRQAPEEPQASSVQSKTKKLFSQSGLESFFKKSSLKVGAAISASKDQHQHIEQIKIHGERSGAGDAVDGSGLRAKIEKKKFTGQPQLDYLLHTIIDYILRDFIHSWFSAVSDDKEFVDVRTKQSIEETVANLCLRWQ